MLSSGVPITAAGAVADSACPFTESHAAYGEVIGTRLCALTGPELASVRHWGSEGAQESRRALLGGGEEGIASVLKRLVTP